MVHSTFSLIRRGREFWSIAISIFLTRRSSRSSPLSENNDFFFRSAEMLVIFPLAMGSFSPARLIVQARPVSSLPANISFNLSQHNQRSVWRQTGILLMLAHCFAHFRIDIQYHSPSMGATSEVCCRSFNFMSFCTDISLSCDCKTDKSALDFFNSCNA